MKIQKNPAVKIIKNSQFLTFSDIQKNVVGKIASSPVPKRKRKTL